MEEGTSFKLNVIVLPNDSTNKEVKWTSSNESIATVTNEGLVRAIGIGTVTITAKSIDGNKNASCEVTVNKKVISTRIRLDDISKEANELALNDLGKIRKEFMYIDEHINGKPNEKYWEATDNGGYRINELGREESKKQNEKLNQALNNRVEIINRLVDNKKSFIILYHTKECEERAYSVVEGAKKILKENSYSYLYTSDSPSGDDTLEKSKIDTNKFNGGSIIIIKNGEVYAIY